MNKGQKTNPRSMFSRALGLLSFGRPLKLTSFIPPQTSPPRPASQFKISRHARSLTALCIGTIVFMSAARGLWFLRAIAAKNCSSEGYTHFSSLGLDIEESSRSRERGTGVREESEDMNRAQVEVEEVVEWSTGHDWAPGVFSEELWSTGHLGAVDVVADDEDMVWTVLTFRQLGGLWKWLIM